MTNFGEGFKKARLAAGISSTDRAASRLRDLLPDTLPEPSGEKLRRLEIGRIAEGQLEWEIVVALAKLYRVPVADLSPEAFKASEKYGELLEYAAKSWCFFPLELHAAATPPFTGIPIIERRGRLIICETSDQAA